MKKRLGLILLILLIIAASAATYLFWPEQDDLSHLATAGEPYDARILRDEWGVPHVFGQTDPDVAYGLAYAHAEDDFLTIQQTAIAARGDLARIYGPDAAPNDYMVALLRIWEQVEDNYESGIEADTKALLAGYAAGLNHYAALHEEEALPGLFPITPQDMVAAAVHKSPLFFGLDGTLGELFAEERQNTVSTRSPEISTLPYQGVPLPRPLPAWLGGSGGEVASAGSSGTGSNTFAVSPTRTANGETFLAVNSHQPWSGPVSWYEAHLHSEEGWDAAGALFPGVPTIVHGHNRNLGWAFTVNDSDLADVYVLEINPENPNQYRYDGQWRELEVREVTLEVKLFGRLRWPVKREVLWSVYGPAVRQDHGTYAIRYAGRGRVGIFEQLYRLNKARNFQEWQDGMRLGQLPTFNVGYADREGNIYYLYNGLLPLRADGYDWQQYLPGDTPETLWTGYLPFEQLPQVFNPPAGFIQNCNSSPFQTTIGTGNPDPAAYSPTLGIDSRMSNRATRALDLFRADSAITWEEFHEYKYDMRYATEGEMDSFIRHLVALDSDGDPDLVAGQELLAEWDRQVTPDNRAAALAVLTAEPLDARTGLPDEEILATFKEAVNWLLEHHGRLDVPWQEVNRLQRGDLDIGLGGGPDVLHAVYGERAEDGHLHGHAGDSYVMLVRWDAAGNVDSRSIHQFGAATARPESPHYADQAPLFAARELKPVWLDEAQIRAHLAQEYRPGEESK